MGSDRIICFFIHIMVFQIESEEGNIPYQQNILLITVKTSTEKNQINE